jgi:hypothetical protein
MVQRNKVNMATIRELAGEGVAKRLGVTTDTAQEWSGSERMDYQRTRNVLSARGLLDVAWLDRQVSPSWANLARAAGASGKLKKSRARLYLRRLLLDRKPECGAVGAVTPAVARPPATAARKTKRAGTQERAERAVQRLADSQSWKARAPDPATDDFLDSYPWRRMRMAVLARYGARCQCCGATPADGVRMHVDHIKPRRLFPKLALEESNLQVLCEVCNHGKGNWDTTDWRRVHAPAEREEWEREMDERLQYLIDSDD